VIVSAAGVPGIVSADMVKRRRVIGAGTTFAGRTIERHSR